MPGAEEKPLENVLRTRLVQKQFVQFTPGLACFEVDAKSEANFARKTSDKLSPIRIFKGYLKTILSI